MQITVRIDRRAEVLDALRAELRSLGESIAGLSVELVEPQLVDAQRDAGKFRDFVDVAVLRHHSEEVLEWAAEELVDEFGWLVDIGR